jgi:hypothetical protein
MPSHFWKLGHRTVSDHIKAVLIPEYGNDIDVTLKVNPAEWEYQIWVFVKRYAQRFRCEVTISMRMFDDALDRGRHDQMIAEIVKAVELQMTDAFCKYLESIGLR